ncbi:glycosyltransferase family 2 protein [Salinibacter sp.]|uniref:glycosyltransferase family 2 protein n=1 Tax=Salinibacter sp. TaxID=2065818 RepID=UPI0021E96C25|nr:glycosyltransferase family 2 protein [Salinibacter sp.]
MQDSTLALCIPAYNAAGHLPRLLESAEEQTEPFDQVLVYDDCSTDNTAKIARSYGATVISGDENQGCTVARKRLAEHATTDWVHFHDADDKLLPNFVVHAREWMIKQDAPEVILFGYEYRDEENNELLSTRRFDSEALRQDPIDYTIRTQINPFCGLYHREAFVEAGGPDTDPKVLYNEDCAMHCKLARAGLQFDADPTVTVINYRREGSMSREDRWKNARSRFHVLRKAAQFNGDTHGSVIARNIWSNLGRLTARGQWDLVDPSVRLACDLDGRIPSDEGLFFQLLCAVSPIAAPYVREYLIRILKPHLRDRAE